MRSMQRKLGAGLAALALLAGGVWPGAAAARAAAAPPRAGLAGVYVLAQARGERPPVPFAFEIAGGTVSGVVDGARVILAPDGTYRSDVTIRWENAPALPMLGLESGREARVVRGAGRYTVRDSIITLQPGDWMSRRLTSAVTARANDRTLTLLEASGGLAGARLALDAQFTRVR